MDHLNNNGYLLFKNVIPKNMINGTMNQCCQSNDTINYFLIKNYIDDFCMPYLKSNLSLQDKPLYCKFRFSNNNNSTDASTFHADIYNHTKMNIMPIYTCLSYFDDAYMEIIPKTFIKNNNTCNNCLKNYRSKKILSIPAGSILLINAQLYHRGVDFSKHGNRRLLQVFEIFLYRKEYENLIDNCYAVQTNKIYTIKKANIFSKWASTNSTLLSYYSFIHYLLVYFDLQYKVPLIDLPPFFKHNRFITYEPSQRINYEDIIEPMKSNINIICDNRFKQTNASFFYLYLLIFVIVLIAISKSIKINKKGKIKINRKILSLFK